GALKDKNYDVEIVEFHHRRKKDAPSGTALKLAEEVAVGSGWNPQEVLCFGRKGMVGQRPHTQIGIHAVRGGDIVGQHTVIFAGEGESLSLWHQATSRTAFGMGALRAARWIAGKAPGLYGMGHVLGLVE
ncbi:MAG TPA: 4-hydroxy-tetrahydrodipicolinate reductase, partial [Kiritimatiellae bacterium]|nr:4-hydroxy-tetrahydrodipicolinate reductase [Kiritimatiellia bacterium]